MDSSRDHLPSSVTPANTVTKEKWRVVWNSGAHAATSSSSRVSQARASMKQTLLNGRN